MAKVKTSEMPHYELLYIISNKFSEDELSPIKEKVNSLITNNQGRITFQEDWGKKRLAYPIKHFRHGYYQLLEFDLPAEQVKALAEYLRLSDQILRHQIVKKDRNTIKAQSFVKSTPVREEQLAIEQAKTETTTDEVVAEKAAPAVEEAKTEEIKKPVVKPEIKKEDKKASDKDLAMHDLDEKLDKILDSDTFL